MARIALTSRHYQGVTGTSASLNWMFAKLFDLNLLPFLLLALLSESLGCASPGQPQPPSLRLPALAEKVTAERDGEHVSLVWTTPATTTDGQRIKGNVTAVVCLDSAPSANAAPPPAGRIGAKKSRRRSADAADAGLAGLRCDAIKETPAAVGAGKIVVDLAPTLSSGPPMLLAYTIELLNAKGRSAGLSAPAFVAGGTAPSEVAGLDFTARREGALLRWKAASGNATVELKRTLVGPLPILAAARTQPPTPFVPGAQKAPPREVVLRADAGQDVGGMIDTTALDGSTYRYVAQRVQAVTLAGHTLELRSAPSVATTFSFHDTFPPKAPTGLVLIPGGGFGEPPSIDLTWDVNDENDMAGYNVYRRESPGGFIKVTAEPVVAPTYRDLHVQPGQRYTYRITAVDQRHNESAPGGEVGETLRK